MFKFDDHTYIDLNNLKYIKRVRRSDNHCIVFNHHNSNDEIILCDKNSEIIDFRFKEIEKKLKNTKTIIV